MKVLHIINNLGSGGAEKLLETMLPIINGDSSVQIDVLLLTKENNVFEKNLLNNNVEIHSLDNNLKNPLNMLEIRKFIINNHYSIIHAHLFPTLYWVSLVKKTMKRHDVKFVVTEHSTHNNRRKYKAFKVIEKLIYKSFDRIICITDDTKSNLIKWLDISGNDFNKFITIENGIPVNYFKDAEAYSKNDLIPTLNQENILICMVGRFSRQKDQETLIKSLNHLSNKHVLILVGEGANRSYLEDIVDKFKLKSRVYFLGFRNDINRILKTSDLVVLSSNWEGFGLAAIEGMASGKPVIVSNIEGLRDVVGNAGFLFEQGNEKDLANTIINVSKLDQLKVKEEAEKHSKNYSVERMANQYIDIYRTLRGD